jgi:hypothetical protein
LFRVGGKRTLRALCRIQQSAHNWPSLKRLQRGRRGFVREPSCACYAPNTQGRNDNTLAISVLWWIVGDVSGDVGQVPESSRSQSGSDCSSKPDARCTEDDSASGPHCSELIQFVANALPLRLLFFRYKVCISHGASSVTLRYLSFSNSQERAL